MTDRLSPARRSENMRRIRSRNTGPEMAVRRLLHGLGYRNLDGFQVAIVVVFGQVEVERAGQSSSAKTRSRENSTTFLVSDQSQKVQEKGQPRLVSQSAMLKRSRWRAVELRRVRWSEVIHAAQRSGDVIPGGDARDVMETVASETGANEFAEGDLALTEGQDVDGGMLVEKTTGPFRTAGNGGAVGDDQATRIGNSGGRGDG